MTENLNILLADDDADDRFFFQKAINSASVKATLQSVENGEKLMKLLSDNSHEAPDALFLDLNMPRKNGSECLKEIRNIDRLKELPIIIYSTSLHDAVADVLFRDGAHFYLKKTNLLEMQKVLNHVLTQLSEKVLVRPERDQFILTSKQIASFNHSQ